MLANLSSETNTTNQSHPLIASSEPSHPQSLSMPPSYDHIDLSIIPIEIIERIVYWVYYLPPTTEAHSNQQTDTTHNESGHQRLTNLNGRARLDRKFQRKSNVSWIDIRSLALVNRAFYQMCFPYLYKSFNLHPWTVERLNFILEEVIKKHPDDVRHIWWRVSDPEVEAFWDDYVSDEMDRDPKWRFEVILKILELCPHVVDLDLDLNHHDCHRNERLGTPNSDDSDESQWSDEDLIMYLSIKPITQLSSLTHISLVCPALKSAYTEQFLVNIISNLSQLQSFTCSRIEATHPKPLNDQQPCRSPLGLHLASLTHLVELDLEGAECLDASWNQLDWKSSLEVLALEHCNRVSIPVLHEFLSRFQSTLIALTLDYVPYHHDSTYRLDSILQDLSNDGFRFNLPELTQLEILNPSPHQFLPAFHPLKNLSLLTLGDVTIRGADIEI